MKDKILPIIFIILFMNSEIQAEELSHPAYIEHVNEVIQTFVNQAEKEFGLVCIGDGGRMPFDVEEIEVSFIAYKKVTMEEARELEILTTEKLLQVINDHKKLRPYLRDYPFTHGRVDVSISFRKRDNSHQRDGSVGYVFQAKNQIHYFGTSIIKKKEKSDLIAKEPYAEALKKVKMAKSRV